METSSSQSTDKIETKRKSPTPRPEWTQAYIDGNLAYPQSAVVLNILVGSSVINSFSHKEATWEDFIKSRFKSEQTRIVREAAVKAHAAYEIPDVFTKVDIGYDGIRYPSTINRDLYLLWEMPKRYLPEIMIQLISWAQQERGIETPIPSKPIAQRNAAIEHFLQEEDNQPYLGLLQQLLTAAARGTKTETAKIAEKTRRELLRGRDFTKSVSQKDSVEKLVKADSVLRTEIIAEISKEKEAIQSLKGQSIPESVVQLIIGPDINDNPIYGL